MKKISYRGKSLPVEKFLEKIFGSVPSPKIKLSLDTLKKYSDEINFFSESNLETFRAMTCAEDFANFIMSRQTQGQDVKELLEKVLIDSGLNFDDSAIKSCKKDHVYEIFFNVFDFNDDKEVIPPPQTSTPPEEKLPQENFELSEELMHKVLEGCKFKERFDADITQFTLTEKMPVTLMNEFYMMIPSDSDIYFGATAIVPANAPQDLAAFGSLQLKDGKTHILLDTQNIKYKIFRTQRNFFVVFFPQSACENFERGTSVKEAFFVRCRIDLREPEHAQTTLCIDFGTSNTTAGSYGIINPHSTEPEIVEFLDEIGDLPRNRQMLPTVVYVDSCRGGKLSCSFGYEAIRKVIANDYNPAASVFYELKRWLNSMDATEEITDEAGYKAEVSHREIITAYLEHVLDLAEQYFNRRFMKLHFTAPVKLKDSFIEEMQKIFQKSGRTVLNAELSIDEGIAIIYNHIAELMKDDKLGDEPEKVLIMDCGGGTTDLASCEYFLDTAGFSNKLNIRTQFENGDSNFGGTNVTFRIFQLLKIKLAHLLETGQDRSIQELISDENDLLNKIDDEGSDAKKIYGNFEAAYNAAENFVPTKFATEPLINRKSMLKRNFYYLWQMAEAYKIEFYRAQMDRVVIDFDDAGDRKIGIPDEEKYYLFVQDGGNLLVRQNPLSGLKVTNNDIHRLLYADIYLLLKNLLAAYTDDELLKYTYYKLSGQSCKITLFNELLKEFIPGKYLRYGDKSKRSPDSGALKLACIKGSICYMRDTEFSEIKPIITMNTPKLIFTVRRIKPSGETKIMLRPDADSFAATVDITSSKASRVMYQVVASNGTIQNTVTFDFNKTEGRPITSTEIEMEIKKRSCDQEKLHGSIREYISNQIIDISTRLSNEGDSVFAMFVLPSKAGYGFYIYCVKILASGIDKYRWQEPTYCSFEDNALHNFFDGSR